MAQVTKKTFSVRTTQEFNNAVRFTKERMRQRFTYVAFDKATLHPRCYADASFASSDDLLSQLGFIVALCFSLERGHIFDYQSHK